MAKSTEINVNIYPFVQKPEWLEVGTKVTCVGEGSEEFEVMEIDEDNSRAAIKYSYGSCWESFSKLSLKGE